MMKKIVVSIVLIGLCLGGLALLHLFNVDKINDLEQSYIAHAGGMIDGVRYTNCLEAVEQSIKNGFRFIELDLSFSSDGKLVCVHDWKMFHLMTDSTDCQDPISYEDFCRRKICGKYTPLTPTIVDSVLENNPNLFLVTDKISSPEVIEEYFGRWKSRILVECFSFEDYWQLMDMGYYLPMLSFEPTNKGIVKSFILSFYKTRRFSISMLYVSSGYMYSRENGICVLDNVCHVPAALYWHNQVVTSRMADSIFQIFPSVKFVYADCVSN